VIDEKMIPDEVVEAAAKASHNVVFQIDGHDNPDRWEGFAEEYKNHIRTEARAAIAAALASWPGAWQQHITSPPLNRPFSLILPLTEARDWCCSLDLGSKAHDPAQHSHRRSPMSDRALVQNIGQDEKMSEETIRAALVEKVAQVLMQVEGYGPYQLTSVKHASATAAINIIRAEVLEEAAVAAHEAWLDGVPVAEIPAAIRALKG